MRFLADVAAEAVGDASYTAVTAALAGGEQVREQAYERMRAAYDALELARPERGPGEFVPSFISTRDDLFDDYGQAPYFVARAVLYGHRVAVANPLRLHRRSLTGHEGPLSGFERDLRVALLLGPFERKGLVIYLDPDVPGRPALTDNDGIEVLTVPTEPSGEDLDDFYRTHLAEMGIYAKDLHDRDRRYAAELQIAVGWWQVQNLLAWQSHHRDVADLYVPEHLRAVMEWVLRRRGSTLILGERKQPDHGVLSALCRLPTIAPEALGRLTPEDLIGIREERIFTKWRESLLAGAQAAEAAGSDTEAVAAFARTITSSRDRLLKEAGATRPFMTLGTDAKAFGVSMASRLAATAAGGAVGGAATASIAGALAGALAGAGATVLPPLMKAATSAARQGERREALEKHLSLFASDS